MMMLHAQRLPRPGARLAAPYHAGAKPRRPPAAHLLAPATAAGRRYARTYTPAATPAAGVPLALEVRALRTVVDETLAEMGRPVSGPSKKVAVCAVIRNLYAGRCAPG